MIKILNSFNIFKGKNDLFYKDILRLIYNELPFNRF